MYLRPLRSSGWGRAGPGSACLPATGSQFATLACGLCPFPPWQPLVGRAVPRWAAVLFPRCSRLALSREPQKSSAWAPSGQFLSRRVGVGAAARDVRSVRTFGPSECAWSGDHCGLPWVWGSQAWAPVLVPEPVWGRCDQGLSGRGPERVPLEQLRLLEPG